MTLPSSRGAVGVAGIGAESVGEAGGEGWVVEEEGKEENVERSLA